VLHASSVCLPLARPRGYTLFETLTVVALLALGATATAPSWRAWLLRDRVDQTTRALLNTFDFARAQAQRTGRKVTLCRIDSQGQCANTSVLCGRGAQARADNWACGWLVTIALPAAGSSPPRPSVDPTSVAAVAAAAAPIGADPAQVRILRQYGPNDAVIVSSPSTALSFTPPAGQVIGSFRDFQITPAAAIASPASAPRLAACIRLAAGGRPRVSAGLC